jgi:hypothetical protein
MESFLWYLRTLDSFGSLYVRALFFMLAFCWDFVVLTPWFLVSLGVRGRLPGRRHPAAQALSLLVVIPSLLRNRDELDSMMSTVESIATNGYPGRLTIIVTIDGTNDAPPLYAELRSWAGSRRWNDHTSLHVTGTPKRRSKPMAIEHAMCFLKSLVAHGVLPEIPPVYVSTDADADLGPNALEAIVYRIQKRNRFTGAPARVVAGSLHVRGNSFWQGWRHYFSVGGQLNLQVAREYYVGNMWRYNIRALPITGVPGAFYCTWTEIFLSIPSFFGYLRTLRSRDWLLWWLGVEPPKFSQSKAEPIPELIAGDTDDTVTAYMATIARYKKDGHFTFDVPRTPLHSLYYLLRLFFVDRPLQYEPRAGVYTSSPTTIKSLFKQRKRWNSSRIELTGRFWRAIGYHWGLGLPVLVVKLLMVRAAVLGALVYFFIPFILFKGNLLAGFLVGYACQVVTFSTVTAVAVIMNGELGYWRMLLGMPFTPLYNIVFNWAPGFVGATNDLLLFGNITGFAPEWTLKRGRSVRVALLFRLRRALLLTVRSVVVGDVPFGAFWFGWSETPWTPSGFEGWTTGKKPRSIVPPIATWFRGRKRPSDLQRT